MKNLIFALSFFIAFSVNAQSKKQIEKMKADSIPLIMNEWIVNGLDTTENGLKYTRVVEVKDTPKNQLFTICLTAISRSYVSGKVVTQNSDKESGVIFVSGNYVMENPSAFKVASNQLTFHHNIKIDIKDNKLRMSVVTYSFDSKVAYIPYYGDPSFNDASIKIQYPFVDRSSDRLRNISFSFLKAANYATIDMIDLLSRNIIKEKESMSTDF